MSRVRSKTKLNRIVPTLLDWFAANARDLPWRRTRDPYAIWVSEVMLQQTQVKTVIPYWKRWMRELPTVQSLARVKPEEALKLWEGLGYYTRVRNLQKAAKFIVERHDGKFPQTFDEILPLPGIGRYTAGAICSIAFNQPMPVLDGNVIRVLTRVFGIATNPRETKTNARLWQLAQQLVAQASLSCRHALRLAPRASHFNQSLMELGAVICTPRAPDCAVCPVRKFCVAWRKNQQQELPNIGKRIVATQRRFIAFVVERNGKFLVRQRPAGVVNAHLWEFPNIEVSPDTAPAIAWKRLFNKAPARIEPLCVVKHSITRYRITLEAFHKRQGGTAPPMPTNPKLDGFWLSGSQLRKLPFSGAHRKILPKLKMNKVI